MGSYARHGCIWFGQCKIWRFSSAIPLLFGREWKASIMYVPLMAVSISICLTDEWTKYLRNVSESSWSVARSVSLYTYLQFSCYETIYAYESFYELYLDSLCNPTVAMTAPVLTTIENDGSYAVGFYLPQHASDPPKPVKYVLSCRTFVLQAMYKCLIKSWGGVVFLYFVHY